MKGVASESRGEPAPTIRIRQHRPTPPNQIQPAEDSVGRIAIRVSLARILAIGVRWVENEPTKSVAPSSNLGSNRATPVIGSKGTPSHSWDIPIPTPQPRQGA